MFLFLSVLDSCVIFFHSLSLQVYFWQTLDVARHHHLKCLFRPTMSMGAPSAAIAHADVDNVANMLPEDTAGPTLMLQATW